MQITRKTERAANPKNIPKQKTVVIPQTIPDQYNRLVNLKLRTLRILIKNLKLITSQLGMWIMWSDTHHATGESFKNQPVQDLGHVFK